MDSGEAHAAQDTPAHRPWRPVFASRPFRSIGKVILFHLLKGLSLDILSDFYLE